MIVHPESDEAAHSIQIGGVVLTPLQSKHFLPSLEKWAARLVADRFQILAEQGASRYAIASNWGEDSLEEVLFWSDLLPNYYYRVGPPSRDGLVFDLGAYHGLFGLAAAIDVGPGGRVFCFEPDAKSRSGLEANSRRSTLMTIEVIPAGVSGRTEKRSFVSLGGLDSHFGGQVAATGDEVQVYSLPDCCKTVGIDAPSFVKSDIEGSEVDMVEAGIEWIKGLRSTVFAIASYHIVGGEPANIRVEQALRKAKYSVATTREGHQTTVAWSR